MQPQTKQCQNCKNDFVIESDDFAFYEKMNVPEPNTCPLCRFKMRALWRNEMSLYTGRKCDLCNKAVISMYNPKSPYKIYCRDCYYSDKWDPRDYAMVYDVNRDYIDQLKEFLISVPKINLGISKGDGECVNSDYTNMVSGAKNCYLVFNSSPIEEVMYSRGLKNVKDSLDLYFGVDLERTYDSVNVQESSGVLWSNNVVGCVDSAFLINCSGLTNCFGCVNLRNKSNCFLNEQLTKDEYNKKISEIMGSYEKIEEFKKIFNNFSLKFPMRENHNLKSVDSTGDYLFECKNTKDSFEVAGGENCRYIFSSKFLKDSIGTTGFGTKSELLLEVVATGFSTNVIGSYWAENSQNILNSFYISNCTDCIACDGLKNGKYSIFNKQYTKEEYCKFKNIIIEDLKSKDLYGLMMPPELAPFAYNETIGQDNFPMTKEETLRLGFRWEEDIQQTKGKETIAYEQIPDNIKDVNENITKEVLCCIECERNYRITQQELIFYKKMDIPVPRKCFYCRHKDRIKRRGPYKFWDRNCNNCNKNINTNYDPNRPEIVYCESCYQKEVI
ncbi:hypothetical protein KC852_01590 [Candidatus Nomurabacteria bacterium]|nr:hypothetical protein [Candidatus Nomurabacteria bacterium]